MRSAQRPAFAWTGRTWRGPRVPLSRLGLMQYLTPTIQFLIGVLVRHEPLGAGRLIGFILVWAALVIFTIDSTGGRRRTNDRDSVKLPAMEPA